MATAAKKIAEIQRPTKGVKPDMKGVPGELISLNGLNLVFGRGAKPSPYDALLDQLAATALSAPGQVLRFSDMRAKPSIYARAKKKGMRVSFAEDAGLLYVRYDGSTEDDTRTTRREQILHALKLGPLNGIRIATKLREAGDAAGDAPLVARSLEQLLRDKPG